MHARYESSQPVRLPDPAAEPPFNQPGTGVRFDWGLNGAAALARVCAVLVVVDMLSFTTSVTIAVSRGMRVHPFPWSDQAAEYARRIGGTVATSRQEATAEHPWSLSPAALSHAPAVADLVLPSPNGAAICSAAGSTGIPVVAGCLRNATAVAHWLLGQQYGTISRPIGVIAAGERWSDGTLRMSIEDLVGAGAVLNGLVDAPGGMSVEAAVTLAAYSGLPDPAAAIRGGVSAGELRRRGFGADVDIAVRSPALEVVPVLRHDIFTAAV